MLQNWVVATTPEKAGRSGAPSLDWRAREAPPAGGPPEQYLSALEEHLTGLFVAAVEYAHWRRLPWWRRVVRVRPQILDPVELGYALIDARRMAGDAARQLRWEREGVGRSKRFDEAVEANVERGMPIEDAITQVQAGIEKAHRLNEYARADVDPKAVELDKRIRAYEEAHGCSYLEAAIAIGEESA